MLLFSLWISNHLHYILQVRAFVFLAPIRPHWYFHILCPKTAPRPPDTLLLSMKNSHTPMRWRWKKGRWTCAQFIPLYPTPMPLAPVAAAAAIHPLLPAPRPGAWRPSFIIRVGSTARVTIATFCTCCKRGGRHGARRHVPTCLPTVTLASRPISAPVVPEISFATWKLSPFVCFQALESLNVTAKEMANLIIGWGFLKVDCR